MSIDALQPFAGTHAIQSAAFVVEWGAELSASELQAARALIAPLKRWFPTVQEQKGLQINLSAPGSHRNESLLGYAFQKPSSASASGIGYQLEVNVSRCQITIFDYTRWRPTWELVQTWLEVVLNQAAQRQQVSAIGLQYTDVFKWRDDPAKFRNDLVLARSSKYVAPHAFECEDLWHCHHGYFRERTTPVEHKLLENINLNAISENGQRVLAIVAAHKGVMNRPLWGADAALNATRSLVPDFHERNKELLRDLLTPEVQQMIKLNQEPNHGD